MECPRDSYGLKCRFGFYKTVIAFCLLACLCRADAQVQVLLTGPANNLFNTGLSPNGTLLGNNQLDPQYTFTTSPAFGTGQTFQVFLAGTPSHLPGGWVANTATSQWITVTNSSVNAHGPSQTFNYQITLTNIPVGAEVHLMGHFAADDNAIISTNSNSAFFSNSAPFVTPASFATYTNINDVFVAGATNTVNVAVGNVALSTGLNLDLTGSYYTALSTTVGLNIHFTPPIPLTPNQNNVLNTINTINQVGVANACFANLTASLLGATVADFGSDLDQLTPEKLGIFSSIAFNDASFRTQNLDDHLAHRRDAVGEFRVYPDKIDASGLTLNDPTMDPALAQVKSRLLAWSPARTPGLLSDTGTPELSLVSKPAPRHDPADSWNFFVGGDVILGQNFSQPELDHTDYTTSAFQIGADYQFSPHFLAGVLFDYGHTDTALDNQGSSATIDSYSPGVFASYAQDGWFANALGTWSRNAYTEQRHIVFGTFDETAIGAPVGDQEMANLDGGYEFHTKHWTYGPTAGVQYTHLNIDPFTERNGCSADLSVGNQTSDSLRTRFGGRISYKMFDRSDRVIFTPFLDASWQHEFFAGSQTLSSSFTEVGGGNFTVSTPRASRDSALLVTGLNADITDDVTLFANYAVQAGEDAYFGQSVQAGMKLGF